MIASSDDARNFPSMEHSVCPSVKVVVKTQGGGRNS